jgi:gas vesicle structural protein
MKPLETTKATLVDLLDRLLDKGVVISADVIVSVAGVPLLAIQLRAALAGIETMIEYGMMQEIDAEYRVAAPEITRVA